MTTDDYRLYTLEEAARLLGVRWGAVRDLVESGQLRHVRVGTRYRVPASALAQVGQVCHVGVSCPAPETAPPGRSRTGSDPVIKFKKRLADGGG